MTTERVRSVEATQGGNMGADAHTELTAADFPPGHVDVRTRLAAQNGTLTEQQIRDRLVQLAELIGHTHTLATWLYEDAVRGVIGRHELRAALDALKLAGTSTRHAVKALDEGML